MNTGMLITLVCFLFVAFCLLSGKIPGSVACGAAVVVLMLSGIITEQEAVANFVGSSIVTMIGMMIVTAALMKTDIMANIAGLIKKAKGGTVVLLAASMIIPFFLCQFVGGVTAMITVIPLAMALAEEADVPPTVVVLPASVGAQAGLLMLPIGGAAAMYLMKNQMITSVGIVGQELGFWDLFLARLPGTLVCFIFVMTIGWKLLPQRGLADSKMLSGNPRAKLTKSDMSKGKQYCVYAIFVALLVLMSTARSLGLTTSIVAIIGAVLVMLLGFVPEREAYGSINWTLIFMMGFMLAITTALTNSGAGNVLANLLSPVYGSGNLLLASSVTFVFCAIATQFMDNMSLINILTPICALAAYNNGIPVLPIVLAVDASCLVSFSTPLASPSSLLAYQLGGYSMKEMMKFNLPIILLSSIVSIIWLPIYAGLVH